LEILPGFLAWSTFLFLVVFSYIHPVGVAYFIIAFDVYWLLLVIYLGIHLVSAYRKLQVNKKVDWRARCETLKRDASKAHQDSLAKQGVAYDDIYHLVILPTYKESLAVLRTTLEALKQDDFPKANLILVLAIEEREGAPAVEKAETIRQEYKQYFHRFLVTRHPDNIPGELKGKGANQTWAAKQVKKELIDPGGYRYDRLVVSVFDIDTVVYPGYFYCLTYRFLTVEKPFRASYQPVPVYFNNIWQAPFFSRVAASSNTFWQMMQQIRQEKLATYSSHSMSWQALMDIGYWSTTMVSEDSRIFWHCFLYYRCDYRVEPLHIPVSMDVTMDERFWQTARNLYKQQRRWGWGVENIPYLIFNSVKFWKELPKRKMVNRILVQIYGFHSWATNALIIAVVGWMPLLLGGDKFHATVLSTNLPFVTRTLMMIAMLGLVVSAVVSTLLLPKRPKGTPFVANIIMVGQWLVLPFSIIIFGAIPALESQTRLMLGKYLGFWVTPKSR
jgi:cellulose synthase/poly-beta-1,6-N-acetylglucosamine synthase-like glycosyltransferase